MQITATWELTAVVSSAHSAEAGNTRNLQRETVCYSTNGVDDSLCPQGKIEHDLKFGHDTTTTESKFQHQRICCSLDKAEGGRIAQPQTKYNLFHNL